MKKNQVNAILVNQTKRRNTVFCLSFIIIIIFILALAFLLIYKDRSKIYYVSYKENNDIDYKVYLTESDYFEEGYLDENKQYISNLIDHISTNFKYELSLDEKNIEYKYSYRVEADVEVKHKGISNLLYSKTEEILPETLKSTKKSKLKIEENIDIDYNYYNTLVKQFINLYDLKDTVSTLTINMYINVIGSCEDFVETEEQQSVMTLTIPLTEETLSIELSDDLVETENTLMQCKSRYTNNLLFLIMGALFAGIDLILIIVMINYIIKNRTAEDIYERELKKILNNYSAYIQTVDNEFEFDEYKLIKLNNFTDLLEIRDTIRQPILMRQNNFPKEADFFIPSNTKILYLYKLEVKNEKDNPKIENIEDEF